MTDPLTKAEFERVCEGMLEIRGPDPTLRMRVVVTIDAMNLALDAIAQPEAEIAIGEYSPMEARIYDAGFADGWNAAAEIAEKARLK